jgi:xylose dehydrogenase (NAD/NADP)
MIRFGILGTARIARALFGMPLTNVEITAIASRDEARAGSFARQYNIPRSYSSYDALIADRNIEAVYIPLPQHLHHEYVVKAATAGKHVLVEKPVALTVAEVKSMQAACKKNDVLFMEALMYRFMRIHNRAKEILQAGTIGRLQYIDYNLAFNARARGLGGFRFDKELGGGSAYDLGIYGCDFIRFITGQEPKLLKAFVYRKSPEDIDEFVHAVYKIGNVVATLTCGFNSDANYYTLSGDLGSIHNPVALSGRTVPNMLRIHLQDQDKRYDEHFPAENPYKWQIEYFARCIENKVRPFLDFPDSMSNMKLVGQMLKHAVAM